MVLQQARTRAVLAALGIPLWGARDQLPQPVSMVPVWGKHQDDLVHVQDQIIQATPKVTVSDTSILKPESIQTLEPVPFSEKAIEHHISKPSDIHKVESNTSLNLKTVQPAPTEKSIRLPFAQVIATSEAIHVEQVIRFSLEARVIGEWVVLVSVQALNHPDRNALWKNISQALIFRQNSQEVCRFDWPLAEGARWQQNAGAQAALMGFLTRFGSERRMGLMGELPDAIVPDRLERLPSLDELLREPLKKRSLWRLLNGSVR